MKKIIIFILMLVVCKAYSQIPFTFDRNIEANTNRIDESQVEILDGQEKMRRLFFIHGLGGDASSWSKVPDACQNSELNIAGFPARKCLATTLDYSHATAASLHYAAMTARDQISAVNLVDNSARKMNPRSAIMIGHSQGAMVARAILHNETLGYPRPVWNKDFGGAIFIAGPLQGAAILNNRDYIPYMLNHACVSLTSAQKDKRFLNGLLKAVLGRDYLSNACEYLSFDILPIFFNKYYDNITKDYLVGSEYLRVMDEDEHDKEYCETPKIAFYCVEPQSKIFWRTVQWLVNDPNKENYFSANEDLTFYKEKILPIEMDYRMTLAAAQTQLNSLNSNSLWFYLSGMGIPYYLLKKNKLENTISSYTPGVRWFEEIDEQWQTLIGAVEFVPKANVIHVCSCPGIPPYVVPGPEYCVRAGCQAVSLSTIVYQKIVHENDGIVCAETAKHLKCPTSEPVRISETFLNKNQGSSHMQIRNDYGIKMHLNKAFEGDYGRFFKITTW
ncbi:alpha/beta hydrolase [Bacteroidales bacterium OttesenSCG-928-B11]|nr:alpha/beta hydrolase [Bacteroidales bacterium OttesenSCG-928-B11]